MPASIKTLVNIIESFFPAHLAEDWDNVGMQLGDPSAGVSNLLVTLDVTDDVADEAVAKGAQLILSHHPLIFQPVKNLSFDKPLGKLIAKLIKNDIAVFSAHTNLDSGSEGINDVLARLLGLKNIEVLAPSSTEQLVKLAVFVPKDYLESVRSAICSAGAGWIGNYSSCTFSVLGNGTFLPLKGTNPFIGTTGKLENVKEYRLETIVPKKLLKAVVAALLKNHPYEEVAYDVYPMELEGNKYGLGRIGELNPGVILQDLIKRVKEVLGVDLVKVVGRGPKEISRAAVCGGAGASLIDEAIKKGAQCLITGDVKYHEARDAEAMGLAVIDAGHFFTENFIVRHLCNRLKKEFSAKQIDVSVLASSTNCEPWKYY